MKLEDIISVGTIVLKPQAFDMAENSNYCSALYVEGYGVVREKRVIDSETTINVEQYVRDSTLAYYEDIDRKFAQRG